MIDHDNKIIHLEEPDHNSLNNILFPELRSVGWLLLLSAIFWAAFIYSFY